MRKNRLFLFGAVLVAILLMFQAPLVLAQDQGPDQQGQYPQQGPPPDDQGAPPDNQGPAQDPPSRVARVHEMVGSVSYQPGGQGDWVQAISNRPLTTGDNVWADKDSRAELQIGSTAVRLDGETSLTLLQLDDRTTQLRVSIGSLIVRVRHLDDEDHFEIDTPNEAFVIQRPGEYRVDVNSDGSESDVTVWKGRGEVTGGGSSYDVVAGQRATFTGTDQLDHEIEQIPQQDDFDQWAFSRDNHEDRAESANYISPEITGAEDLDEYGQWHYVADYGPVWTPAQVAVGWAPYRFGHWVWIAPWGWTWVEDEPWGFAPFHYGRWAFVGGAWCWAPGPVVVRPVYAPAFVAFVGGGGFAVGAGPVAWFPLAPHEVFVPWYHTSPVYVNNVNITNTRVSVTQVTNVYHTTIINNNTTVNRITYVNQRVPTAVTAVSHDTFANARPVQANIVHVDQKAIENAPVARNIPVQPVRQSVMGAGRVASYHPPAAVQNRKVVATRTPAPPAAFQQRPAAMNVRTERPSNPQPPVRSQAESRPPANPRLEEQGNPQRPESQPEVARPEPQREEPARPEAAQRPPAPRAPANVPRPPSAEYNHPLVRQAPPVQQRPEVQHSEEQKFSTWQQQRQNFPMKEAPRPSAPAPHPPAPPPHEERPHK